MVISNISLKDSPTLTNIIVQSTVKNGVIIKQIEFWPESFLGRDSLYELQEVL